MCGQENSLKALSFCDQDHFQLWFIITFLFARSRKPVIYGINIHIQHFFNGFILDASGPWMTRRYWSRARWRDSTRRAVAAVNTKLETHSSPASLQRISRFPFIPYYMMIFLLADIKRQGCGHRATHELSTSTEPINTMNTDFSTTCYSECV